jgi:enoyl-CoA hydratase/carnithine racemase
MSDESSYEHILFAVEDGVATVTLNRPKRLILEWVGKQADAAEGVRSFLERRPPEWKLRPSIDLPEWPGE